MERAQQVWLRFLGFFGDQLTRKFGAAPPQEWELALSGLEDYQLTRGMRRVLYGWKGGVPTLPQLMTLCRTIGDTEFDPESQSLPKIEHRPASGDSLELWTREGNLHLLAEILGRRGKIADLSAAVRGKNTWAAEMADLHGNGPVDTELQKAVWRDYVVPHL